MDAYLAIVSKRDLRSYASTPVDASDIDAILDAGRIAGSGVNRQRWRFDVVTTPDVKSALSSAVWSPRNVATAPLAIAISITGGEMGAFDAGRAAQNMMLAAWNLGLSSCPNGVKDVDLATRLLGIDGEAPFIILSIGFPVTSRDPSRRTADEWVSRANRVAVDEVVHRH